MHEDVPIPALGPGEVLVRVHAVGVNPPDWYLRDGYRTVPNFKPPVTLPVIQAGRHRPRARCGAERRRRQKARSRLRGSDWVAFNAVPACEEGPPASRPVSDGRIP